MVFATSRWAGSAVVLYRVLVYASKVVVGRGSEHGITEPRIEPLGTISKTSSSQQSGCDVLRLVLFLYIMRCPHSLQRIGSRDLISFFTPQSKTYSVKCALAGLDETYQRRDTPSPDGEEEGMFHPAGERDSRLLLPAVVCSWWSRTKADLTKRQTPAI